MSKRCLTEPDNDDPLILLYPSFVSTDDAATLLRMCKEVDAAVHLDVIASGVPNGRKWTAAEQRLIVDLEARLGEITGCPPHDEEMPLLLLHERPAAEPKPAARPRRTTAAISPSATRFASGLHVDPNGGMERRYASALLYLTTPTTGGQTVFPFGRGIDEATLAASRKMIKSRCFHTSNSKRTEARTIEVAAADAPTVRTPPTGAGHATTTHGVATRAVAGNLLVFWSRTADGSIDPRSWHTGEDVPFDATDDKWLLRKFKEVPVKTFEDEVRLAEFVARSRRPHLIKEDGKVGKKARAS